eukprot:3250591-Rhodomonas_salina.4
MRPRLVAAYPNSVPDIALRTRRTILKSSIPGLRTRHRDQNDFVFLGGGRLPSNLFSPRSKYFSPAQPWSRDGRTLRQYRSRRSTRIGSYRTLRNQME